MDFDFARAVGLLVAIVAVATVGLASADVMATDTVFMMVLPSMILFAVVSFLLGMKHGEYRAAR
jgi:cellulase/cellobiase CelA1